MPLLLAALLACFAASSAEARCPPGLVEKLLLPVRTRWEELRPGSNLDLVIKNFDRDFMAYYLAHAELKPKARARVARRLAARFHRIVRRQGYEAQLEDFKDADASTRRVVWLVSVPSAFPDLRRVLARGLANYLIFDPQLLAQRDAVSAIGHLPGATLYFVPSDILYPELSDGHLHEVVHLHQAKLLALGRSTPYQAMLRALDGIPITKGYAETLSAEEMHTFAKETRWALSPKVVVYQSADDFNATRGRVSAVFTLAYEAALGVVAEDPSRVVFGPLPGAEHVTRAMLSHEVPVRNGGGVIMARRSLEVFLPELGPESSREAQLAALERKLSWMREVAFGHRRAAAKRSAEPLTR